MRVSKHMFCIDIYAVADNAKRPSHLSQFIPVSTHRNLHNVMNSIMLPTQAESWDFIQNVQAWEKGAFMSFLRQSSSF
jgi:hypothetical protein